MNKWAWVAVFFVLAAVSLGAQSVDLAAGGGTALAGKQVDNNVAGGFWPELSATKMFDAHIGINGEFSTHLEVGKFAAHPWVLDANFVLRPGPMRFTPELMLGYGWFDTGPADVGCEANLLVPCTIPKLNRSSFHLGGAVRTYLQGPVFLQVEYHLYLGDRLWLGESGFRGRITRLAVVLGYTWGKT
ncbi:MAG: hypothetical protein EPN33_01420 [Acidobacteria bacterium]|nr:MAG: hypothetical protein EPN33_01420 [Acidobacteriota bacterium]